MRELLWGGGFTLLFCLVFFSFVIFGWPGSDNSCLTPNDKGNDTCFCESFEESNIGKPGIRQPFNTLSNFYVLLTAPIVGFFMVRHRKAGVTEPDNRMQTRKFYSITYLLVLIYLGLGSMWFHASIVEWGGIMDQVSMFTFAAFLLWYTVVRMTNVDWFFYIGYPVSVLLLTVLGALGIDSLFLIGGVVIPYVILQVIIWCAMPAVRNTVKTVVSFWVPAVFSFILAIVFWALSNTGGLMCLDTHAFQFHGLWHWLAGVMALLLYFFFQKAPR